ncbi:MAG: NmrA family NAD(P)-binding protein [Gammaproteobacteria bacterium]|nr:NmrA family NAD(P)-binding protein [Gammaproteobacteria bacterium]
MINVLLTGATGLVGGEVARLLGTASNEADLAGRCRLHALVRDRQRAQSLSTAGVTLIEADLDDLASLAPAVEQMDAVLLVSPATPEMVRQQGNLVDALANAAKASGKSAHVVKISGFMTALDSASRSGRWHAAIEAHIESAGLPATLLRPPFFMQNLLRLQPHSVQGERLAVPLQHGRIAMVDARDLAAVAARGLLDRAQAGARYLVTGPRAVGFDEVARAMSTVLERPVRHDPISPEQMAERLRALGTPAWRIEVVLEFYAGFEAGLAAPLSDTVQRVTGRAPLDLEAFLIAHRDVLRAAC